MGDNQSQSYSTTELVPRLLRSLSKTQPIQQVASEAGPEQTGPTPVKWIVKQKATAIGHFTKLTHRGRTPAQGEVTRDNDADSVEWSSQALRAVQSPIDTSIDTHKIDGGVNSAMHDDPGKSPQPTISSPFAKRMQDMFSTFPPFASSSGSDSSRFTPPAPQTEVDDTYSNVPSPSPVRDPHLLSFLTLPNFENGPLEHGWKSFWSALDRLRLPYGKTASDPEPSRDDVLDCIDDNNSVMMYGPLEPDDTSEVEIACSEIVSINGDGEVIRTPQPHYSPLPSEFIEEALVGRGPRTPPSRFVPLPLESIDQVLMGCGREVSGAVWKESESEVVPETTDTVQVPGTTEPGQPPVKEYRVWLPSPTKISVQTMWWGFRM